MNIKTTNMETINSLEATQSVDGENKKITHFKLLQDNWFMNSPCPLFKVPDYSTLSDFIEDKHDCLSAGKLVMYVPEKKNGHFKGKFIVESHCSRKLYFEVQIAKKSNFENFKVEVLDDDHWRSVTRYYNLFLAEDQVELFVQDYLFAERFTQRFLITSASSVMGSMNTQRLRSGSGQVFAFRQCALKE